METVGGSASPAHFYIFTRPSKKVNKSQFFVVFFTFSARFTCLDLHLGMWKWPVTLQQAGFSQSSTQFTFWRSFMLKTTFGGGAISPSVSSHLNKCAVRAPQQSAVQVSSRQIGGGAISPSVVSHIAKKKQIGGGAISPSVAAHLAKRNISKK